MNVIHRVRSNQFLRHNTIFFFGSVAVGALNYLYYPILGRLLPPAAFGEVQTLVSLFLQLSIFLTVLSLVIVTIVTNTADEQQRNRQVLELEKVALAISAVVLIASFVLQRQLQHFLRFDSGWPFVLLALAIVATVPFIIRGALLRGKQRFGLVAAGNMIGAGGKILLSVTFVLFGLGTTGAIGGLLVAQVIACLCVGWWAYRMGLRRGEGQKSIWLPNLGIVLHDLKYAGWVLVGSLAITLQYSIDIIIIKHYFDAHTAGLYAGIASAARVVFFLTASIAQVLISSVRLGQDEAQNTKLLQRSLLLLAGISLPILLLLTVVPDVIMHILLGSSYGSMAPLLPRLTIAIFIVSIVNLFVSYYLALRHYGVAAATLLGLLITCVLILRHHQTPAAVVDSLLWGSMAMCGTVAVWVATHKRKGGILWRLND